MKKFLLILFSVLLLWSCGNKNQFKLSGEIVPSTDGKMILFGFKDGQPVPVDSTQIVKGKFSFTGQATIPQLKLMSIEGQNRYIAQVFIEPSKINMTIYPDSFQANVIKGSKSQDIFQIYIDEMVSFSKKENDLKARFGKAQSTGNEQELNGIKSEYQAIVENTQLFSRNYIKKYSTSPVAAYVYLMNFIQEAPVEELDSMLKVFEPINTSEFVTAIKERADALRAFSKGAKAPDFTLYDPDGKSVSLSAYKGKYILIDFWASWCKPCMAELPNVISTYNTYKDKGFEIIGVSLDRDRQAWLSTIKANDMKWPQVWDMDEKAQGEVANKYGVASIPHTVLIDKEGVILEVNLQGEQLKSKLAEILK